MECVITGILYSTTSNAHPYMMNILIIPHTTTIITMMKHMSASTSTIIITTNPRKTQYHIPPDACLRLKNLTFAVYMIDIIHTLMRCTIGNVVIGIAWNSSVWTLKPENTSGNTKNSGPAVTSGTRVTDSSVMAVATAC